MPPAVILATLFAAFWHAWLLLFGRLESGVDAVPLGLVLGASAIPLLRRVRDGAPLHPVRLGPAALGLICYAVAFPLAPPLVRIAVAVLTVMAAMHRMGTGRAPGLPFIALALLALPVLPSLDFVLAYPLRLASSELAAMLLRMHGFPIGVDGLALRWGETFVQFDAACSGVRMLWGGLFLVSLLALVRELPVRRYLLLLAATIPLTIFANALRASSLFYVEAEPAMLELPAFAHEATGIAAFAMLAAALVRIALRLGEAR